MVVEESLVARADAGDAIGGSGALPGSSVRPQECASECTWTSWWAGHFARFPPSKESS